MFKDLAQKAQQARTRLAAQIKEQQQRLGQDSSDGASASDNNAIDTLRLLQIQNDKLRERLRAAVEENERLQQRNQQRPRSRGSRPSTPIYDVIISSNGSDDLTSEDFVALQAKNRELVAQLSRLEENDSHRQAPDASTQHLQEELRCAQALAATAQAGQKLSEEVAAAAQSELRTLQSTVEELEKHSESLRAQIDAQREDNAALRRENALVLEAMQEAKAERLREADAATKESEWLQETIADLQAKRAQESSQLRDTIRALEASEEALRSHVATLEDELDALRAVVDTSSTHIGDAEGQVSGADVIGDSRDERDAAAAMELESFKQAVNAELEAVAAARDGALQEAHDLRTQLERAIERSKPAAAEEGLSRCEEEQDDAIALRSAVASAAAETEAQLHRLREEHAADMTALEEQIRWLQAEVEQTREKLSVAKQSSKEENGWLRQGAEELTRQLESSQNELKATKETVARLEAEIASVREDRDAQLAALTQQLERARQATNAAAASLARNEGSMKELQTELEKERSKYEDAVQRLEAARSDAKDVQLAVEKKAEERALSAETHIELLQRRVEDAERQASTGIVEEEAESAPNAALERRDPDVHVDQRNAAMDSLRSDLQSARQEAEDALERALAADAARQEAAEALAAAMEADTATTSRLQADLDAASGRIAQLEALVSALSKEREGRTQRVPCSNEWAELSTHHRAPENVDGSTELATPSSVPPLPPQSPAPHKTKTAAALKHPAFKAGLVPHHRRDASFSSEIEPIAEERTRVVPAAPGGCSSSSSSIDVVPGLSPPTTATPFLAGARSIPTAPAIPSGAATRSGSGGEDAIAGPPLRRLPAGNGAAAPVDPFDAPPPPYAEVAHLSQLSGGASKHRHPPPQQHHTPRRDATASAGAVSTSHADALLGEIETLRAELRDSEQTHALRDTATAVLKEELAELRRSQGRTEVDLEYLKEVLVKGFASGELEGPRMVRVLSRLLQWSPKDVERAQAGAMKKQQESVGLFGKLTGSG